MTNTLIIHGSPVLPFHKIYVLKDKEIIDTVGVQVDSLNEVVFDLVNKYDIHHINLSGAKAYMEGLEAQLKNTTVSTYSIDDLTFSYM